MPASDTQPCEKRRILVIDDETDIRELMDAFLSSVGYEVCTAENGAAAVELAQREVFDLAITDLRMPGMSGVETLSALKRVDPGLPVVVVSGYVSDDAAAHAHEAGAARIVGKPVDLDDLLRIVDFTMREAGEGGAPWAPR